MNVSAVHLFVTNELRNSDKYFSQRIAAKRREEALGDASRPPRTINRKSIIVED
jgi:hypothetical protein